MQTEYIACKHCQSKNIIRKGWQKTKFGAEQLFFCKSCQRKFSTKVMGNKTYSPKIITAAISAYNLGNTLEQSAKLINSRFKIKLSKSAVHEWLKEFQDICTYNRLRESLENYCTDILFGKTFEHNGLSYDFQYHTPKLELLCNDGFSNLANYVKDFENGCPKFFDDIGSRCSQAKINISIRKEGKYNNACRLASLALKATDNNRERHKFVENFMLVNDSSTVACEVPVWLWEKNFDTSISGHVDILQIRNGLIHILDFKPEATKEDEQKVASQLFFYASGLSFRTGIKLDNFRCAWFDDRNYFEFCPKDAKVRFENSKWRRR